MKILHILLILCILWSTLVSCFELKVFSKENKLRSDVDLLPLKGNWLNFPQFSNFKLEVQPRNRGISAMVILIHGFIKRDGSNMRNPYQIYSKSVVFNEKKAFNISHFFDSDMEQFSTESCFGTVPSCSQMPDINSNIPFHHIMKAYENNTVLIGKHVKMYDVITDSLCNRDENDLFISSFHKQHYLICVEKGRRDITALKYIVGREFIAKVIDLHPSTVQQSEGMFKSDFHRFPKKKKEYSTLTMRSDLNLEGIGSGDPKSAHFFNADSHTCILPWLKGRNCEKMITNVPLERSNNTIMKRCVFIHGYGTNQIHAGHPVYSSTEFRNGEYWGMVDHYTPFCSERVFMREESSHRGWDNTELQIAVSKILVPNFRPKGVNIIRNTIIYAHSMGNLIVAGAIRQGLINIDSTSTSWYNIMGPILGSPMADLGVRVCSSAFYNRAIDFGLCVEYGKPTGALLSLQTSNTLQHEIAPIISKYVSGTMCGTRSSGLNPIDGFNVAMASMSTLVMGEHVHDGAVPFYSCKNTINSLDDSYQSSNYQVAVNHYDGTCANGDGWFDNSSPCSYYLNKK